MREYFWPRGVRVLSERRGVLEKSTFEFELLDLLSVGKGGDGLANHRVSLLASEFCGSALVAAPSLVLASFMVVEHLGDLSIDLPKLVQHL